MNNKYNKNIKTLGPKSANLVTELYEKNKSIFNLKDVQKILNISSAASRNLLYMLVNKGIATRLKPGLFILVPYELGKEKIYIGNPYTIARYIMTHGIINRKNDYYISYGSAMEVHSMVTQPQLIIYISSLKMRRPVKISGYEFRFVYVKKEYFFGLKEYWVTKQEKVIVSDIEKTIIDGLNHPEYCGGITEVAQGLLIRREDLKVEKLIEYAIKMKKASIICRLGYLLEFYKIAPYEMLEILKAHLTKSYIRLDPILPPEGKFLRKWRLQINIPEEELLSIGGA